ncbi:MAG: sugar phosphate isomerase/epimerase [Planctomycetota bacterium]|nr:MAG: sugar phosphate isomerase/epimerase [Planctomycetota bacterium]
MKKRPRISAFPKCYLEEISQKRTMSVFDWIQMAKDLPAEGLEMYEGFLWELTDSFLGKLSDELSRCNFEMPMLCCSPDFTHPERSKRVAAVEYQKKMIEVAFKLGGAGTVCRVLSGQRWPEVDLQRGLDYASEGILACIPTAQSLGVVLGIENHYKDGFWLYPEFAQKKEVFLALLDRIPESPNFGVQYDPSNAVVAGDDPLELLDAVLPRVVSMHASDRYLAPGASLDDLKHAEGSAGYSKLLLHGVTGKGLNNYPEIFRRLSESGYSGWISIEDGMNGMGEMRESLLFLQEMVETFYPTRE